jgi:hypothetical protein
MKKGGAYLSIQASRFGVRFQTASLPTRNLRRSEMEEREVKSVESIWRTVGRLKRKVAELEAAIPRWISAEERLPEENGDYLCVYTVDSKQQAPRIFTFYSKRFVVRSDYTEWVTHWMPLPAPPVV